MKTILKTLIILFSILSIQAQDSIKLSDFRILDNTSWTGTLSYKDYQSGKQSTIDAKLQIVIEDEKIQTSIQYVYEPHKNNISNTKIRKNGTYYGNEKIVSNTFIDGTRTIVTSYRGMDNRKKATMFNTHKFNDSTYSISKEVLYDETTERFVRNTYTFTKL